MITSCKKDDNPPCACGVENPQDNLEWLRKHLDKRFCTEIYLYKYNGEEFIGIHDCPIGDDYGWAVYKCDGTLYCQFIGFTGECDCTADFLEKATKTLIYKQTENPYFE